MSSTNFKINLTQSLTFPDNSVFYIDDVSIPNAWYVVEENINDKLYINVLSTNNLIDKFYTIKIDPGNYTSVDFADELHNECKLIINDLPNVSQNFLL